MRCAQCVLERANGEALPLEQLLDELSACEGCPALDAGGPAMRAVAARLLEAGRALRRTGSKLRQREQELREQRADMDRYELRMCDLERLHRASTEELEAQLALVQAQRAQIEELSTPMIEVDEGVLALPIVGSLTAERAAALTEALLAAVQSRRVRFVVLDLTGLRSVDAGTAETVMRVCAATRLLGAEALLSGVQGGVARALCEVGGDLGSLTTVRSVKEAIRRCRGGAGR